MRLLVAPPGYEREAELAVVGAMKAVESLVKIDAGGRTPVLQTGAPVYVAVFSSNEGLADVEAEVRRVLVMLIEAAGMPQEKVA